MHISPTVSAEHDAPYVRALNPEQREAVITTEGPLLVLAGAGTGKTRVLTSRIAHLLGTRRAWPGEILAVTFTNKAAREMSERVAHLLQTPQDSSHKSPLQWLGTFHSIAAKIVRRHAQMLGLTSSFTILDTDDQIRVIKTILQERNIDEKEHPAKMFASVFSSWKDKGLTPDKVSDAHEMALPLYRAYQERLRALNACDFGDLLLHNLTLFARHPEVLEEIGKRFKYILVDEYQDTNIAQYLWLRLLAAVHQNICCVGDDDQSIYGWRGAEVGNILRFEKDFPGAKTVRLERNYRSTKPILAAAAGLISYNKDRLGKTLWTESQDGNAVRVKSLWDENEEARFVADEIHALGQNGISAGNTAILVRAGFQTRPFEERFLTEGIPYRVVGGLRFYERQEIRDAVAYLRLVSSEQDDLAFARIVNLPKRGVGKATLEQITEKARAMGIPQLRALEMLLSQGELKGKVAAALTAFVQLIHKARGMLETQDLSETLDLLLLESGYKAMWQMEKTPEAQGRVENLNELVRAVAEFENLTAFLEHIGLVTDDMEEKHQGELVSIMTLHAAKGLEFKAVFLPGWEEGLFPHQRALDESGTRGLEEERRLAYVGITRARETLFITHAANRRIYNQWQSSLPSRFLSELPQDSVEFVDGGPRMRASSEALRAKVAEILGSTHFSGAPKQSKPAASTTPNRSAVEINDRIFHLKFGYGRVMSAHGNHLEVAFEKAGVKKVLADYVERVKK